MYDDSDDMSNIKCINYTDDGNDTVLSKIGHGALDYGSGLNNATWKDTQSEGDKKYNGEIKNSEKCCVVMPEYLYMLNLDGYLYKDSYHFDNVHGLNINYHRGLFTNIYWGYIEDIVGVTAKEINEGTSQGDKNIDFSHLPSLSDSNFSKKLINMVDVEDSSTEAANTAAKERQNDDIRDKIHKILNIGETIGNGLKDAAKYVTNWLKAMVDSLFIGWHNHMVGVDTTAGWTGTTQNIGNATKSGVYSTAMGYMTTPTFNSLPVTGWIMANFTLIYVILMIFIVVILLMMVITRARRLPQAILIFICMAFLIILPANMLNGAISISNEAAEKIFANKFQYWEQIKI